MLPMPFVHVAFAFIVFVYRLRQSKIDKHAWKSTDVNGTVEENWQGTALVMAGLVTVLSAQLSSVLVSSLCLLALSLSVLSGLGLAVVSFTLLFLSQYNFICCPDIICLLLLRVQT